MTLFLLTLKNRLSRLRNALYAWLNHRTLHPSFTGSLRVRFCDPHPDSAKLRVAVECNQRAEEVFALTGKAADHALKHNKLMRKAQRPRNSENMEHLTRALHLYQRAFDHAVRPFDFAVTAEEIDRQVLNLLNKALIEVRFFEQLLTEEAVGLTVAKKDDPLEALALLEDRRYELPGDGRRRNRR